NAGVGLAFAIPTNSISIGFVTDASLTATVRGEFDEEDDAFLATLENAPVNELVNADLDRDLKSRGRVLASAVTEAGISIAHSFSLANGDAVQVGVTPSTSSYALSSIPKRSPVLKTTISTVTNTKPTKAASTWTS